MLKTKIRNLIFLIFMPIACFLLFGIFSFSNALNLSASAVSGDGGIFLVSKNSTLNLTGGSISGGRANNGGGVYVASGGTVNMTGGEITNNKASSGGGVYVDGTFNMSNGTISGNSADNHYFSGNIYVGNGVFTMTGGTVGSDGLYSSGSGTLNLFGGTLDCYIFSESSINTKPDVKINDSICLSNDSVQIIVQDYNGVTPNFRIQFFQGSRQEGVFMTFLGNKEIEPDITKLSIAEQEFDHDMFQIVTEKDDNGNWTVALKESVREYDFPSDWKTQVVSETNMTTTVTPANLTSIKFVSSVPSEYTKIGTLSTGLPVYKGTTSTDIAFVAGKINAPSDSAKLFSGLSKLGNIDSSVFDTYKVTDMQGMFDSCSNLTSLDVSSFNTSKVIYMNSMFYKCSSLTSLDLSNFDTSKVISMPYMFYGCSNLTSLNLSDFNTSNVQNMFYMFYLCSKLTSLNLRNFDTSKVTDMSYMFYSCGLTTLDLSSFNTSKVTDMSHMFYSCSSLTSLDLRSFDTLNVTIMSYMFGYCPKLASLDVSNFNTSNVEYMHYMFYGCSKLTSLDLNCFDTSKVTYSSNMLNFGTSNKIQTLKTPYNNTSAIDITTGSTLYNVSTGASVSSVPANTTTSQTYATKVTLTFDANGGTCNTTSATAYYNVSLHDSGFVFPYPTKSGYMFSGWYQNTSFVGTKLSLDSVFTTNCKFYAKWEEQNQPSGGGSSNSPLYISWEETGRTLVNEVSSDIMRYNSDYTLESIDGFVIISDYNYSSFQDYTLVECLNISHLPVQIYIVELNPEGPNASYINCSNCLLIVAIYVQKYAFGISNTWEGAFFDENEQLFRELAPNAIFWDLRGFCTENFKPEYNEYGELTTEQYKLILGRQVQLCILPENFNLGIDWSLSEAGCVVQNYLFEDVTGDYSFVSSKNNDQNEIYRDIAKFSLNFNQERTIQNIWNLNDEKLLETKRKIKLVSNVKKE